MEPAEKAAEKELLSDGVTVVKDAEIAEKKLGDAYKLAESGVGQVEADVEGFVDENVVP